MKKSIRSGKICGLIFFGFLRAFETIDRDILLKKLEFYGITGKELKWFRELKIDVK